MHLMLGWMLLAGLPFPTPHRTPSAAPAAPSPAHRLAAGRIQLWTDRDDPYPRGSAARLFLSVDEPSYVAVLRVDTDGRIRVLFPREPWGDNHVQDGQALEVTGARGGRSFIVNDDPGIGYLFAVASAEPLDFRDITRGDYWDYRLIDGGRVQGDPYVSLTDLAARMAPEEDYDYDVVPYYVDHRYDYPRFVCYDCHAYASYTEWDPYRTTCSRFRVVVRDDPRYYPYRYGGGRNVVPERPLHPGPRYLFRNAEPGSGYVTRVPGRVETGGRRNYPDDDRGVTSDEVGGRGSIPTPAVSSLRRPGRTQAAPELSPARPLLEERRRDAERRRDQPDRAQDGGNARVPDGLRPAPAPQSTGEPELKRRRP